MATTDILYDPLTINLQHQTRILLESIPADSLLHDELRTAPTRAELLCRLSRALLLPRSTLAVASAFRPLLLDLCARWLEDEEAEEDKLEALCLLLEVHPELFPCVVAFLPGFHLRSCIIFM